MSSDLAAFEALENRLGELERRVHGNQVKKNEDMIIVPKLTGKYLSSHLLYYAYLRQQCHSNT